MRTLILLILCCVAGVLQAQLFPALGGQRAGISALSFLKIDVSPRSAGMAGAMVARNGDAFATYWNPAALTDNKNLFVGSSNTFWVDGINHAFFSAGKPFKFGTLAISATSLTTGKMERRTEFQPGGTGEYFYASNTAIGISYAKRLTDMFSYGATIRYVNETLAEFTAHTALLDMGFLYRTDFRDLNFAVMMQSFGPNSTLRGKRNSTTDFTGLYTPRDFPAPTVFMLGVSMVPIKKEHYSLAASVQLNHPSDNAENIRIGTEFHYRELLYARLGYRINVDDFDYPTAGLGVRTRLGRHPFSVDYSVDPTRYLGWIHRVGLSFYLNTPEVQP